MEFPTFDVVSVAGFCLLCWPWAKDNSAVMLLPAMVALVFPLWTVPAAGVTMVAVYFIGTLYHLISGFAGWGKG